MTMEPTLTQTILVVEDDPAAAAVVRIALERHGFTVVPVKDLSMAQTQVDSMKPALMILDVNLPDGSGFEFLRRYRAKYGNEVPVLVLSGLKQDLNVVRGLELGANDFVTKPFSVRELLARVDRLAR